MTCIDPTEVVQPLDRTDPYHLRNTQNNVNTMTLFFISIIRDMNLNHHPNNVLPSLVALGSLERFYFDWEDDPIISELSKKATVQKWMEDHVQHSIDTIHALPVSAVPQTALGI